MHPKYLQKQKLARAWLFVFLLVFPLISGCGVILSSRKKEERQAMFAYDFYRDSNYYRAIIEYKRLVKGYPKSRNLSHYLFQAAESYYLLRKFNLAIPGYRQVTRRYPDSEYASKSELRIGQSLFQIGGYRESIRHYRNLAKKFPTSRWADDALYYAGNVYQYQLKDSKAANKYYRRVVFEFPDSDSADDALRSLMWYELRVNQDPAAAQHLCQEIIKRSPQSKLAALAQFEIAKIYREQLSDSENSLMEFQRFTKKYPRSAILDDVLWEMGLIYEDNKEFEQAIKTFNKLIDSYPFSHFRERAQAHIDNIYRSMRRRAPKQSL